MQHAGLGEARGHWLAQLAAVLPHVCTGSIFGAGAGRRLASVQWSVAGRMALAWLLTLLWTVSSASLMLGVLPETYCLAFVALGYQMLLALRWTQGQEPPLGKRIAVALEAAHLAKAFYIAPQGFTAQARSNATSSRITLIDARLLTVMIERLPDEARARVLATVVRR